MDSASRFGCYFNIIDGERMLLQKRAIRTIMMSLFVRKLSLKSLPLAAFVVIAATPPLHALVFKPDYVVDPNTSAAVQQQQIDASNAALVNLATYFQPSNITLRVKITFKDLTNDGTLGQAGPEGFQQINGVAYAQGLYNFLTRTDLAGATLTLSVEMNTNATVKWNYTNSTPAAGEYSWQDVIMHEVGHSMGFFDTLNKDGSFTQGAPSIFETLSFYNGAALSTYDQATRAQAIISNNVFWNGQFGLGANSGTPIKLFTPNPYQNGSTYSHLDPSQTGKGGLYFPTLADGTYFPGPTQQEMAIFHDIGWVTSPINVQLANISTRVVVGSGDQVGIGGFIIRGTGQKKVLIRGIGPSLSAFGVNGALSNPTLELFAGQTSMKSNDDWRNAPEAVEITNTGAAPTDDREAAMVVTLDAGTLYTAILKGAGGATGIGVVEIYDLAMNSGRDLANISTRGNVLTGDNLLIGGFIVHGLNQQPVVVRGMGPTLGKAGVAGSLADPVLQIVNSQGAVLIANDNWKDDPAQAAALQQAGFAPEFDAEAAIIARVPAGSYTAQLRGKNDSTGVGSVEVYNLGAASSVNPSAVERAEEAEVTRVVPLNPAGLRW